MPDSILAKIGNTPLVEITRMNPNPRVRIFAKLEYFNPGGSIKDRPALTMIEAGERSGELSPEKTVIEATSGNTGIGLALVCAVKGHKLLLTMSEAASAERRKILMARGASIRLTPGHLGTDGAIEEAYRMAREEPEKWFITDQFNNPANWQAHYEGTGREILDQTKGSITHFVATMGTTGTLMGISRRLKEANPDIRVIGVEPYLGHKIQGLKNLKEAYVPEIFEKSRLDEKINIEDELAFETARQLAKKEGLFVGMSSGAAMAVAMEVARGLEEGVVVTLFPDSGERYLSTSLFAVREETGIFLHNALSRTEEPFEPKTPGKLSMYTCGPTASGPMDLSECRRFVFADLAARYFAFRGFEPRQVLQITDMDDKTIAGSEAAGKSLEDFAQENTDRFLSDLKVLGIEPAREYPRTTGHGADMVRVAEKLADKGFAYEKLRSLYFDISRLESYGELSGVNTDKVRVGHTVDLDEYEKDNPQDFTLFKRSRLSELKRGIFIKTAWGNVRPSWSLQCAAVSLSLLGEGFDLHISSRDLAFPHHENENAIARALSGNPLARYWLLCDRVNVDGRKMGADERLSLTDLLNNGYTGREIRYWLLSAHYSKPIAFSSDRLDNARKALARLDRFIQGLASLSSGKPHPELDQLVYDLKAGFCRALDHDLGIAAALAHLFSVIKKVNRLMADNALDPEGAAKLLEALKKIDTVLNVMEFPPSLSDPEIQKLVKEREAARKAGDYETADALRDRLAGLGISVRDGKRK